MAGFSCRSPTFSCCFNENDTSTLKLSPFLLLISDELVIFALDKVFIIEGNTSVRLLRCGLKGIVLLFIQKEIGDGDQASDLLLLRLEDDVIQL